MATIADQAWSKAIKQIAPEHLAGDLIQSGHELFGLIWINPNRLSGSPCFYGSRVPIQTLFEYVESGHTIDQFLDDFEGVTREQVTGVLELARAGILAELPPP